MTSPVPNRATVAPGDYGRVTRPDGTAQWYVRSPKGAWIALRYQRVIENEDGSITLVVVGVIHVNTLAS